MKAYEGPDKFTNKEYRKNVRDWMREQRSVDRFTEIQQDSRNRRTGILDTGGRMGVAPLNNISDGLDFASGKVSDGERKAPCYESKPGHRKS
jgi:hypothetical protein